MELLEVRLGVRHDLVVLPHRTGLVLVRWIADLRRPITDDEDDLVTPARERAELPQPNGVAEAEVRRRRVEAHLDTEPTLTGGKQSAEVVANDDLGHPTRQELVELTLAGSNGHGLQSRIEAFRVR